MSSQGTREHSHNLKFWSCKNLAHQSELSLSCFLPKLRWMTEGSRGGRRGFTKMRNLTAQQSWVLILYKSNYQAICTRDKASIIRPLACLVVHVGSLGYLENQHPNIQLRQAGQKPGESLVLDIAGQVGGFSVLLGQLSSAGHPQSSEQTDRNKIFST